MGTKVLAVRHVEHESLGAPETTLTACGVEIESCDLFAHDWSTPAKAAWFAPQDWAGLVIMGGPMNVDQTDRYPFLAAEVEWLRQAVAAELPTLGICLGAQLLAKAAGARIFRHSIKEIGWYEIELLAGAADDRLLGGAANHQTVFQWHGDTFDLPAGAVQLAQSATCQQQALRWGQSAWGLQFHLEMTHAMVDDWFTTPEMCADLSCVPYIDPAAIRAAAEEKLAALEPFRRRVLESFAVICHARRG